MGARSVLARIDLVLRFAFVALIPLLLVGLASLFSLTGIVVGAALGTVIEAVGTARWRARVQNLRLIGKPLANFARLGEFYAEHPPKLLLYYVLYPLFLPYWLIARVPRREFLLYRKLNVVAVIVMIVAGAHDYWFNYRPSIPFNFFIGAWIGMFIMQLLATMMLISPIVTTIVILRREHRHVTLVALAACVALTTPAGVLFRLHSHTKPPALTTRIRARHELAAKHWETCTKDKRPDCGVDDDSAIATVHAINAAWKKLPDLEAGIDDARSALEEFYKPDEAAAFELSYSDKVLLLWCDIGRNHPKIWLARTATKLIAKPEELPPKLLEVLTTHER